MWFNEYKRIVTDDGEKSLTPLMGLFGGMSAGCFSTLGNNPFDVIKVRWASSSAISPSTCLDLFSSIILSFACLDSYARHKGSTVRKYFGLLETNSS
jgi:hypothetical protein